MGKVLKYSILKYSPFTPNGDITAVVLGILFSSPTEHCHLFCINDAFQDCTFFRDGINNETVMRLLRGIKDEVEDLSLGEFDISQYIRFWLNDFSFDKIETVSYVSFDNAIQGICDLYFV